MEGRESFVYELLRPGLIWKSSKVSASRSEGIILCREEVSGVARILLSDFGKDGEDTKGDEVGFMGKLRMVGLGFAGTLFGGVSGALTDGPASESLISPSSRNSSSSTSMTVEGGGDDLPTEEGAATEDAIEDTPGEGSSVP